MMTRISQALKKLKEIFNRPEKSPQIIWPSNRHIILFHTNDKINKFKDLLDIISRRLTINITNDCANSPLYFHLQGIRNSGDIGWIFFSGYRFYMCIEKFGTFPSIFSQFSEMVPNLAAALLFYFLSSFWELSTLSNFGDSSKYNSNYHDIYLEIDPY